MSYWKIEYLSKIRGLRSKVYGRLIKKPSKQISAYIKRIKIVNQFF